MIRNKLLILLKSKKVSIFQDELQNKGTSSDVMDCLIKHKNDADVRIHYKCRAAVEHFQIISLKDYHFTIAFKTACKPYVNHYCPKAHNKAQVNYKACVN